MTTLRDEARHVLSQIGLVEAAGLALIAAASWSTYGAPTASGFGDEAHQSIWSVRPALKLNLFELAFLVVVALWLARAARSRVELSSLDGSLLAVVAAIGACHLFALARGEEALVYERVDAERVALLVAGYFVATRFRLDARALRLVVLGLVGVLLFRAAVLVIQHGIIGSTDFATLSGRVAILVTEDSLLLLVPAVAAWGFVVDGLTSRLQAGAGALLVVGIVLVELLSFRRGALLFLAATLIARSVRASRRLVAATVTATVVAAGVAALLAPGRAILDDVRYAAESVFLVSDDPGTEQRRAELENFARNISSPGDLVFGRGLGAAWNTEVLAPVDIASFGSGETVYVRLGWHVYGLDWLYKIGLLGVAAIVALFTVSAVPLVRAIRRVEDRALRSLAWSLAAVSPVFLLFLFTNARVAALGGVVLGLLSRIADVGSATLLADGRPAKAEAA